MAEPANGKKRMDTTVAAPEGMLSDIVTGEWVKDTPKENLLQDVALSLIEEYGFSQTQLGRDARVRWEVDGKKKSKAFPLAVYEEGAAHEQENIIRLVHIAPAKTKSHDPDNGTELLEEPVQECPNCEFALWLNGEGDRVVLQRVSEGAFKQVRLRTIVDMPGAGETVADLERSTRKHRRAVGHNLLHVFRQVHDYIHGNQGMKKEAAFWEILKLVFCKIEDERKDDPEVLFRVSASEYRDDAGAKAVQKRISELFALVKATYKETGIFDPKDEVTLKPSVLRFAVAQLSRYDLLDTEVDVKGVAYEEIVGSHLKGDRGQFFTPRNVVRAAVSILDPGEDDLVIDPACGTGGFLVVALAHVSEKIRKEMSATWADPDAPTERELKRFRDRVRKYAEKKIYGNDFDPDLLKATKMNMVLNNDGQIHIFSHNALESPDKWKATAPKLREAFEKADIVLANPPFGSKIPVDDPEILKDFELAHHWVQDEKTGRFVKTPRLQKSVAPEILFLERLLKFAKPGTGRIGIVVPDGILGNADSQYIRQWLLDHSQVIALVDLPGETFLPHTGTLTHLVFARRLSEQERLSRSLLTKPVNYEVFVAVADVVGRDRRGNVLYRRNDAGEEISRRRSERVIRYRNGRKQTTIVQRHERVIADDLPLIVGEFNEWARQQAEDEEDDE